MTTVQLEIPSKFENIISLNQKESIDIVKLFALFWVDLEFLIKERKYQDEYLKDLKNNNFVISNDF